MASSLLLPCDISEKQDSCLSFDFSSSILLLFLKYFLLGIPFPGKFRIKQIPIVYPDALHPFAFPENFIFSTEGKASLFNCLI